MGGRQREKKEHFQLFPDRTERDRSIGGDELKPHINYKVPDKRVILESMKNHFCARIDHNEVSFNDIARKTKIFMLQEVFASIIENYTLLLGEINNLLLNHYSVLLVLEDGERLEDMIEGV